MEQLQERHYEQYMEQVLEPYLGNNVGAVGVAGDSGEAIPASHPCNGDTQHTDQSDHDESGNEKK